MGFFFDPTYIYIYIYIIFLCESNKSLYMDTNDDLISSIFNLKKKRKLYFVLCIKV